MKEKDCYAIEVKVKKARGINIRSSQSRKGNSRKYLYVGRRFATYVNEASGGSVKGL